MFSCIFSVFCHIRPKGSLLVWNVNVKGLPLLFEIN